MESYPTGSKKTLLPRYKTNRKYSIYFPYRHQFKNFCKLLAPKIQYYISNAICLLWRWLCVFSWAGKTEVEKIPECIKSFFGCLVWSRQLTSLGVIANLMRKDQEALQSLRSGEREAGAVVILIMLISVAVREDTLTLWEDFYDGSSRAPNTALLVYNPRWLGQGAVPRHLPGPHNSLLTDSCLYSPLQSILHTTISVSLSCQW